MNKPLMLFYYLLVYTVCNRNFSLLLLQASDFKYSPSPQSHSEFPISHIQPIRGLSRARVTNSCTDDPYV
jgi:hypothetical protein